MSSTSVTHLRTRAVAASATLVLALAACTGSSIDATDATDGTPPGTAGNAGAPGVGGAGPGAGGSTPGAGTPGVPAAGTGSGIAGGSSTAGASTGGAPEPTACTGAEVAAPKRLIRLTFNQIVNSVKAHFNAAVATAVGTKFEIGDPTARTFPPLGSSREGSVVTDAVFNTSDAIAQDLGKHVLDNFATATGCATATDTCAQTWVTGLAQKAFRRPLTDAERMSLLEVYTTVKTNGGTIQEATQFATYAVFDSPHFVYRTEFGTAPAAEGPLTPFELASQLSYFLTDGPPDATLTDAASKDLLKSTAEVEPHVNRLLGTADTKVNLQTAMFAYFGIPMLDSVIVDPAKAPEFNAGLRNAMYREAQLFLNNRLWDAPLRDLLTTRKSFVNQDLATLYGVAFPPPGATPDADGFAPAELPATRAGILSMPAFLTSRSRPDVPSVVGRGLMVNASILCGVNPPFPEEQATVIDSVSAMLAGATERAKSDYRTATPPCLGCHLLFDQYGLALENYDVIGKYRTADPEGRPIDASVTLPAQAGGSKVQTAVEMGAQLASSGAFETCMAKNLITYALAEGVAVETDGCSTRSVVEKFRAGEPTFTGLVRQVALSKTIAVRAAGGAQ